MKGGNSIGHKKGQEFGLIQEQKLTHPKGGAAMEREHKVKLRNFLRIEGIKIIPEPVVRDKSTAKSREEWTELPENMEPPEDYVKGSGQWKITEHNPTCFWLEINNRWYYICT
jgi:hypothetical protein